MPMATLTTGDLDIDKVVRERFVLIFLDLRIEGMFGTRCNALTVVDKIGYLTHFSIICLCYHHAFLKLLFF